MVEVEVVQVLADGWSKVSTVKGQGRREER